MTETRFELNTFLENENEVFHVARTAINSGESLQQHRHSYAEVFWIKTGKGIHVINGEEITLEKGSLCMIRPDDFHTFRLCKNHDALVVTNIAFTLNSLSYYRKRLFQYSKSYFWKEGKLPYYTVINSDQLNELSAITDRLLGQARDILHLDYLMINIFRMITCWDESQKHIPDWLAYAINKYNTPEQFKDGVNGFVKLTHRSPDHVNRMLRVYLKQTLTETVLRIRIHHACQQLVMTNSTIKSICYDCGFDSVSYFYRAFKKLIGLTPLEYRRKNHRIFSGKMSP